jgi:mannan endo-1,4-beta-mannosidase
VAASAVMLGALLAGLGPARPAAASGSDPQATPQAQLVLQWLSGLTQGRFGRRVASGYFGGYSGDPLTDPKKVWPSELAEISGSPSSACQTPVLSAPQVSDPCSVYQQTGLYPAILACDYGAGWSLSSNGTETGPTAIDTSCDSDLLTWWEDGGLASVSLHLPDPDASGAVPMPAATFEELYATAASPVQQAFDGYLNQIAAGLQTLQAAGVPVLFRPFLEGNGNWFWWGGQSPADFQALWQYTYNYLTTTEGLHNLLWVYAPDCEGSTLGNPGATSDPGAEYPGSGYVDIVGLDCYLTAAQWNDPGSVTAPGNLTVTGEYQELTALAKPFAFAEIGLAPQTDGSGQVIAQDNTSLINAISNDFPAVTYFLSWDWIWGPARNANAASLFDAPSVLNRGLNLTGAEQPRTGFSPDPALQSGSPTPVRGPSFLGPLPPSPAPWIVPAQLLPAPAARPVSQVWPQIWMPGVAWLVGLIDLLPRPDLAFIRRA